MRLTPARLVALRLYNITVGRLALFSRLLRRILVFILIKKSARKYGQSSQYFCWRDID